MLDSFLVHHSHFTEQYNQIQNDLLMPFSCVTLSAKSQTETTSVTIKQLQSLNRDNMKTPFQGCCFTTCDLTPSLIKYHSSALILLFSRIIPLLLLLPQTSVSPQIFCCCACSFLDLLLILWALKCWMNGADLQLIIKPSADGLRLTLDKWALSVFLAALGVAKSHSNIFLFVVTKHCKAFLMIFFYYFIH